MGTTRAVFGDQLVAISQIGADPAESNEQSLSRTILVASSIMIGLAGIVWGTIYLVFGEVPAAFYPFGYSVASLISVVYYRFSHQYRLFRFIQLLLILLVPFFLMLALGGFMSGSAVVLWSLLCPLGATLVCELRIAVRWLLVYLVIVVASGLLQPIVGAPNSLPDVVVIGFFVMNIGAVSAIAFVLLHYFVAQKDRALELLQREQDRSERLLLNVLPKEVAAVLKVENRTIAERFNAASVLFADVVGFTPLSATMAPEEMVRLLNEVFSYFDSLVEKYGLEKIRTIGDNYMVAAGVPRPRADHAQALARLALDIIDYMKREDIPADRTLLFRIGINSGPMVGGVIGQQKFHYDVWGDPVNIASRMESHGVPGKIQIASDTYALIKDEFVCRPRGKIEVKGMGEMDTWYLEGVKAASSTGREPNLSQDLRRE